MLVRNCWRGGAALLALALLASSLKYSDGTSHPASHRLPAPWKRLRGGFDDDGYHEHGGVEGQEDGDGGGEGEAGGIPRQWFAQEEEGDKERASNNPVVRIPRDHASLTEAIEYANSRPIGGVRGASTIVSVCEGSHLMPRRYRIVRRNKDMWQYWLTHDPDWVDGKQTQARIPDDGAEPMISQNYPCKYLPTRDTRFINITKPAQIVGDPFLESPPDSDSDSDDAHLSMFPSPPTRICGGFYLSLPPKSAGSFRRVTFLNQESFVIMASSGAWRIEECSLQASGVGGLGADIMHAENLAQIVLFKCTFQPIRRGDPCPQWACWPPGEPLNGGGYLGKTGIPAILNPSPQDGFVAFGLFAASTSKVMVDDCRFIGMVNAVASSQTADVSLDWSVLLWNQYATVCADSSRLILRTCEFQDNVYGAVRLWDEHSVPAAQISIQDIKVRGPVWADDLRPENLEEYGVEQTESGREFTEGPGRHAAPDFFEDWKPDKWGEWKTDWGSEPGCGAVPDGKGGWKGRDDVMQKLAPYHDIGTTPDQGSPDLWTSSRVDNENL